MSEGKKINDIGVLDVSAVVDGTLYPVYDPNNPTSAARSSAQQIANYVKSKVDADAAHASEQESTDQAKIASVGKVQELIGEVRRVEPITSTPATLDQSVIYLVHDSEDDVVFDTETVPAGATAHVYHDGNGWVVADDGITLDAAINTDNPSTDKAPSSKAVVDYGRLQKQENPLAGVYFDESTPSEIKEALVSVSLFVEASKVVNLPEWLYVYYIRGYETKSFFRITDVSPQEHIGTDTPPLWFERATSSTPFPQGLGTIRINIVKDDHTRVPNSGSSDMYACLFIEMDFSKIGTTNYTNYASHITINTREINMYDRQLRANYSMGLNTQLKEKNIVFLGDSQNEKKQQGTLISETYSYPNIFGCISGANVINCGVGGTYIIPALAETSTSNTAHQWDLFNLFRAINGDTKGGFTDGTTWMDFLESIASGPLTHNFVRVDWDDVDALIIESGSNQWRQNKPIFITETESTSEDPKDHSVEWCLKRMFDIIRSKYPKIRIYFVTPPPHWELGDDATQAQQYMNDVSKFSLYYKQVGKTLLEFSDAIASICKKYNVPCLNLHRVLGWNERNYWNYGVKPLSQEGTFYNSGDGTHPRKGFDFIAKTVYQWITTSIDQQNESLLDIVNSINTDINSINTNMLPKLPQENPDGSYTLKVTRATTEGVISDTYEWVADE